ncbi:serine/threonine-protein kinase AFC3 isoform X3 [Sesamum indicum]|uniref:dual-specificity kinase n=1 Tax=Sesamum indicum TaxID=4182 RepID=A0A8M8UUT8_SESIN|nr:serine/threonine-protein kinase AFC3 isoform X3 [Sesamum indicum]
MAEEDKERQSRKRRRLTWDVAPSGQPEADERDGEDSEARVPPAPMLRRHVSPPKRDDDRDGHYVFSLGENLTPRYKILGKMGEGTFGRVLECWDRQTREYVAVKVVRSISKYRDAAMIEIDVLQHLAKNDKDDSHCVKMHSWFDYRNHICIVFEKLGPSLFDFLKRNKYSPFPVDLVREFGRQLLESVAYMHDLRLIHTDLKPENILLVSSEFVKLPVCKKTSDETNCRCLPKSSAIKLIDFGSTAYDNQIHSSIVSTRHYRAPEIILGLGWTYPCDIWSVGCILVELCTGEALFQTHENLEHLAMMERVLGPLPEHMIRRAEGAKKYFRRSRLNWPEGAVSRESIRAVRKLDQLKNLVSRHVDSSRSSLVNLLHGLLKFDPSERLTARQALEHPFFKDPT